MAVVAAAVTAISGAVSAAFAGGIGTFLASNLGRLLISVAVTALSRALQKKPTSRQPGIRTTQTQTGGVTPASFVIGTYATEGQLVCPPMTHGTAYGLPNAYLTYVIELGDIPGQALDSLIVDGTPAPIGTEAHPDYGLPLGDRFTNVGWIKFYDGTQTAADAMLVEKYGSYPDRPWSSDMVGAGICYAVLTFRFARDVYSNFPKVRFVLRGIPLYDPRLDSSVGGSGSHRWADASTWERSENPAVQAYNILRGITLPGGHRWGGDAEADDLPLSNWWAAMNAADTAVALEAGGTEPQYRSSFEISVEDEPADVLDEIMKAASGQLSEVGGIWKIRLGGPGLPVYFFTDEDIIITAPQELEPYPGISETYNAVHASYPDPESLWESRDAPPRYNAGFEAEDGNRRLPADLTLPASPYPVQNQRLMSAYITEERRMLRHVLTLPPEATALEPLDAVSWTSARNGYAAKVFEVISHVDPLVTGTPRLALRERDASDYDWSSGDELPSAPPSTNWTAPANQVLQSWSVSAASLKDGDDTPRRPAISLAWNAGDAGDVRGVQWELRRAGEAAAEASGSVVDFEAGALTITEGILPGQTYEVRARPIVDRGADWTIWSTISTPDLRVSTNDLADAVVQEIDQAQATADDVRADHDNLVNGFTLGDLGEVETEINSLTAQFGSLSGSVGVFDFAAGADRWVQGRDYTASGLAAAPSITNSATVSLVTVTGEGQVLQSTAQGSMAERYVRPFIEGQKVRVEIRTRLTVDPTPAAGAHRFVVWLTGHEADGSFTSQIVGVGDFNGLTVADGWVIRTCEFDPAAIKDAALSDFADAVSWQVLVGLNGFDADAGGAVQQFSTITVRDITLSDEAAGYAEAALISEQTAFAKADEAENSAVAAAASETTATAAAATVKALQGVYDFSDGLDSWDIAISNTSLQTGNTYKGGKALWGRADGSLRYATPVAIDVTRTYRVRARLQNIGTAPITGLNIGVWCADSTGAFIAGGSARQYCALSGGSLTNGTGWQYYEGDITGTGSAETQFHPDTVAAAPHLFASATDAANTVLVVDYLTIEDVTEAVAEAQIVQSALAETNGKLSSMLAFRTKAGSAGAELELIAADDPEGEAQSLARIAADTILLDGTVSARFLRIDGRLIMNEALSGFSMGKDTAYDTSQDGIYMGRTEETDNSVGFGLTITKTADDGLKQQFEATKANGLRLTNANFFRDLTVTPAPVGYTTDQTVPIGSAVETISVSLIGAGGAGGRYAAAPAADGGTTTVVLKHDGGTIVETWTAVGGESGEWRTGWLGDPGYDSAWGTGGTNDGGDGQGYGSGGGGASGVKFPGGYGGRAGQFLAIQDYDVSGLINPYLEITIGAGAPGHPVIANVSTPSGSGAPGKVEVSSVSNLPVAADVIPITPTATGTISKTGASITFPDLGAGLWFLCRANAGHIDIGFIETSPGQSAYLKYGSSATFVSSQTPIYVSSGSNSAYDVDYQFFKMGG